MPFNTVSYPYSVGDERVRATHFKIPYPLISLSTPESCVTPYDNNSSLAEIRDPRMRVVIPVQPLSGPRIAVAGSVPIIDAWYQDVHRRENAKRRVETRMTEIETTLAEVKRELGALWAENGSLKDEIACLKAQLVTLKAENESLKAEIESHKAESVSLKAEVVSLTSRLGYLEQVALEGEGPVIMFSVLHHLVQRSKGRDPRFRPVDKDRDHPDKDKLRKAVKSGADGLANLIGQSPFAGAFFTVPLVEAFLESFTVNNRHLTAHLEYEPVTLLRKLLALELIRRQAWDGLPSECPETIALRLFLSSIGPKRAGYLMSELKTNEGGRYQPLTDAEVLPIAFLL